MMKKGKIRRNVLGGVLCCLALGVLAGFASADIVLTTDATGKRLDDGSYLVNSDTVLILTATEPQGTPDVIYYIATALYGPDIYVPPIGKGAWRTARYKNVKQAKLSFKLDVLQDGTPIADGVYHISHKYNVYAGKAGHVEGRGTAHIKIHLSNAAPPSPKASRPADLPAGVAYNLVDNPGFEQPDPEQPDRPAGFVGRPFGRSTPESIKLSWESPGLGGGKCIAIEALDVYPGYWETVVPVKPQTVYAVTVSYKCGSTAPAKFAGKDAHFREGRRPGGPNLELGVVPDDPSQLAKPLSWTDIGIALAPVGGAYLPVATDWASYRQTVTTEVTQTRLRIKLRTYCSIQKYWFDNLSVVELADTPQVEMLAPAPAGVVTGRRVEFRWRGPAAASKYFIECSRSRLYVADRTVRADMSETRHSRELDDGRWFWRVGVPDQYGLPVWAAEGTFCVGGDSWSPRDTTPPTVNRPVPVPNAGVTGDAVISAAFSDGGSGIDVASASILLDGADVTGQADVTQRGFTLRARQAPAPGAHKVFVQVSDKAGNRSNALAWRFGVGATLCYKVSYQGRKITLDGEPYFPIGIYNYRCHPGDGRFSEQHLIAACDAGADVVLNTIPPGLDMLHKHGMKSLLNISYDLKNVLAHKADPAVARKLLLQPGDPNKGQVQFKDHPSVLGYWADDPENLMDTKGTAAARETVEALLAARKVLKAVDPDRPMVFAISNLPRLKDCMVAGDVLLSYRYAVPHYHPKVVNDFTLQYVKSVVPDKPLWFNSQFLDLGYAAHVKSSEGFRPTPAEARAMAYYATIVGISGYTFYANYINEKDTPDHWHEILKMASEFRCLAPVFVTGREGGAASLRPDSTSGSIFFREWEYEGTHTMIAVNMSGGPVAADWVLDKPSRVNVMFEDRCLAQEAAEFSDRFQPFEVHVYCWQ